MHVLILITRSRSTKRSCASERGLTIGTSELTARLIRATALPSIASDFQSFNKQGWVSSGFVLGQTSTILLAGQLLRYIRAKHMLLGAIVFCEVGSVM